MSETSTHEALAEVLTKALYATETTGGWWGHPECEEFGRLIAPKVDAYVRARVADVESRLAGVEAERDDAVTRLDRMRRHAISDPEMRALHENAKAYSLAVQALNKKRGGALSTTLAFLIEQDYLIPNDPRAAALATPDPSPAEEVGR